MLINDVTQNEIKESQYQQVVVIITLTLGMIIQTAYAKTTQPKIFMTKNKRSVWNSWQLSPQYTRNVS